MSCGFGERESQSITDHGIQYWVGVDSHTDMQHNRARSNHRLHKKKNLSEVFVYLNSFKQSSPLNVNLFLRRNSQLDVDLSLL